VSLAWDERVVPPALLEFVRCTQREAPCRLAGGAALSGVHLRHRLSRDLDLFCDDRESVREVLSAAEKVASELHGELRLVRDGGSFVRAVLTLGSTQTSLDIAHEPSRPLEPRDTIAGITVDSLADLRASKLTCLLSRSEPRDLVDLYFLDRAALPPEATLSSALEKDAGLDPGILSHLLRSFPTAPLPEMLEPLTSEVLSTFREELAERFRRVSVPQSDH